MVQVTPFDGPLLEKPRQLRVCFQKTGVLQYISHLDLVRTMTRVMVRAHLPIKYTSGFHPIPHLVFSAPLPVGAQSPREFVDIEVLREVDTDAVRDALNSGLPRDLAVNCVYFPETKLNGIASAVYELTLHLQNATPETAELCEKALSARPITVFKHTKAGDRDVDVSPAIIEAGASFLPDTKEVLVTLHLRAEGGSFLNPDYIIKYIKEKTNLLAGDPTGEWYTVVRSHLYDKDGRDFL
jgi:radical SAM-linked protein